MNWSRAEHLNSCVPSINECTENTLNSLVLLHSNASKGNQDATDKKKFGEKGLDYPVLTKQIPFSSSSYPGIYFE